MTMLWYRDRTLSGASAWASRPIDCAAELCHAIDPALTIETFGSGIDTVVALLAEPTAPNVWINGEKPIAGLRILSHRDEIIVGQHRLYYSSESRPEIFVYQLFESRRRPRCVTCRNPIEDGQSCVACPRCGRIYHQISRSEQTHAKECWTYRAQCLCGHPTALDQEAGWKPGSEVGCD